MPSILGSLTVAAHLALKVLDLREGRVLTACSEEIAQVGECDTAVAALVEEGEGLLEVGALCLLIGHAWLATGVDAILVRLRLFLRDFVIVRHRMSGRQRSAVEKGC